MAWLDNSRNYPLTFVLCDTKLIGMSALRRKAQGALLYSAMPVDERFDYPAGGCDEDRVDPP